MAGNAADRLAGILHEWCNSGPCIGRFFKKLFAACVLLPVVMIPFTALGLLFVHLPRVCAFVIMLCLTVACSTIVVSVLYGLLGVLIPFGSRAEFLKKIVLKAAMASSILVVVFGFTLFISAATVSGLSPAMERRIFSSNMRLPLGHPAGIAVDHDGDLYLAVQSYGRIQKYSPRGDFIGGWFVNARGGPFGIWIGEDGFLHADVNRTRLHRVFDLSGNLVTETEVESLEEGLRLSRKAGAGRLQALDSYGNTYSVHSPKWRPRVVKVGVDGGTSIVLEDPLYLTALAPQPASFMGFAGVMMTILFYVMIKTTVEHWGIDVPDNKGP